jgi:predicted ATP-dependent Lon-type protease
MCGSPSIRPPNSAVSRDLPIPGSPERRTFLDRLHAYASGWEFPKLDPDLRTFGQSKHYRACDRRGLREDETKWRTGLPGACEPW